VEPSEAFLAVLSWAEWKGKQDLLPGDGFVSVHIGHVSSFIGYSCLIVIIEGTATIPIAFAAAFVLPDYPETTKWYKGQTCLWESFYTDAQRTG
jgi:hypothetical protein